MTHSFFALGLPHGAEWLYILIGVIILFGADKLPKLARGLGKSLGEFKKAKEDFDKEIHAAAADPDTKTETPKVAGNLPEPIHPVQPGATSVDPLTKKS